ncbi:MAG: DUF3047 domain-containing protein [Deltaproteobacteria bacterium]|nr:DUF3047 domain-containing protein [Deltaproteobacteria bacterium]
MVASRLASLTVTAVLLQGAVPAAVRASPGGRVAWLEKFDAEKLDWVAPMGESAEKIAKIHQVRRDQSGSSHLNARHDYRTRGRIKPVHYGKAFVEQPIPLEKIRALRWRWRVNQHPPVGSDAWEDIGVALYVVIKQPSFVRRGKGFKLAWLAKKGEEGTKQMGLLQIALRADDKVGEWRSEEVDLCALYRKHFGPCEGEFLRYVGVTTDADGTEAVADGDYADFELIVDAPEPSAAAQP